MMAMHRSLLGVFVMNDNSNGEDLLYSEIRNPIFQALENQLRIEFEWAYVDKNLYSFSWIALHLKELTEEDLRRVNNLVKEALNRVAKGNIVPFINTEFILGLCFAARIIYEKRGEIHNIHTTPGNNNNFISNF